MAQRADAIVLGLGGMGSAAAAHLARRGVSVIGLEAFQPNHAHGSSHGETRIIREAYFESPEYVPMLRRAYALWRELEQETGASLLRITGGLNIGNPDSDFVKGASLSAETYGMQVEHLNAKEVSERFPGFRLSDDLVTIYEPTAGILRPEACVSAHLEIAQRHGAVLKFDEPVTEWTSDGSTVRLRTNTDTYEAERLIIAAGPWSSQVLTDLDLPLEVWRIPNVHFEPTQPDLYDAERCPVYLLDVPEGHYYGFPALPGQGVKIGRHEIGQVCTPQTIDRTVTDDEIAMLRAVLKRYLPGAAGAVKWTLTCMYTNTPDHHFIIDRHPAYANVVFGCGFSGHGFKFASAIGEVLTNLALSGESGFDLEFLSLGRFAASKNA